MPLLAGSDVKARITTEADTRGVDDAERSIAGFSQRSIEASKRLTLGILGLGTAIGGLGIKAIQMGGQFEQSQVAFTQMLGSAEASDKFLKDLFDFAAHTPFEFSGIQDASRKLLAFGFQAEDIIPMMTNIGDAVSALGGGSFEIDRVTRALGQMKAKGKVSAEEMMQIAELGIPAWDLLAKKIGVSVPEAMKLAEKGVITGMEGVDAIVSGLGDRFAGGMEMQSKTVLGQWSTLKDTISQTSMQIGTRLIEAFNLSGPEGNIARLTEQVQRFGDYMLNTAIPFLENNKGLLIALGAAIATLVIPAFVAWTVSALTLGGALLPIQLAILAIIAVIALLYLAWNNNFLGIRDVTMSVVGWFTNTAYPWLQATFTRIKDLLTSLQGAWTAVWQIIQNTTTNVVRSITDTVKGMINTVINGINTVIRGANKVGGLVGSGGMSEIPHFADGVRNFGGGLAVVGEEGPELVNLPRGSSVIPNAQIGAQAGVTINQTNNVYGNVDMDMALRSLAFALQTQ